MFIGHYAVAFAAKRAAPRTSLGTLFLAAQFLDLLWPVFLLTGVVGQWLLILWGFWVDRHRAPLAEQT